MWTAAILELELPFQRALLRGTRWQPPSPTHTALLLHGGGTSAADGFRELRTSLYDSNIATVAFDFVGHGCTGGSQLGTTLDERVQQVVQMVKAQGLKPETLALVGFSMGAYVAVKAAVEIGVSSLCLAIPAAYAAEAYRIPFGPEFTKILRAPRSWADSDAFGLVRGYAGHLLVVSAEEDRIVPAEIPEMYVTSGSNCASSRHHVVARSGHNLSEHYKREPRAREAVYAEIASLCGR